MMTNIWVNIDSANGLLPYLNQHWQIITGIFLHLHEGNFAEKLKISSVYMSSKITNLRLQPRFPLLQIPEWIAVTKVTEIM